MADLDGFLLRTPDHRYALADAEDRIRVGWFPGVTEVLRAVARPALNRWIRTETARAAVRERGTLERLVATNGEDVAMRWLAGSTERLAAAAAERGGGVHAVVEALARGEEPEPITEVVMPFVTAWKAWREAYAPRFLAVEAPVLSIGGGYGGTADAFVTDPSGVTWCLDYKTRGHAAASAVYATEPMQVAALASAELVSTSIGSAAFPLPPIERGAIVLLRPDGSFRFVEVGIGPAQRAAFAAARSLAGYLAEQGIAAADSAQRSLSPRMPAAG